MKHPRVILMLGIAVYSAAVVTVNSAPAEAPAVRPESPPVSADHFEPPDDNRADEPLAGAYSYDLAVRFADHAAMDWQATYRCVTCHTNGWYLANRHAAGTDAPAYHDARAFAGDYLNRYIVDGDRPRGQHGSVEGLVATTAFKSISDIHTNGELDADTRRALDHIWTLQDDSGAWVEWLKCRWGPYEADDHFGVTLVALAMGLAGEDGYVQTPAATAGIEKLRRYLDAHPPSNLHQVGMTLWASIHLDGLADDAARARWAAALLDAQREDGGWAMVDLGGGAWTREDGGAQDDFTDAYATAFVAWVLIESGLPREDARLAQAIAWLRANQRQSGRWYTRSPRRDRRHFISHAATNFAMLVLAEDTTDERLP
jgi:squalene-hopene/tetraprenyl-beta-curcumene cyclase